MPLYTYAKDTKAGDVVGQAVGDGWWVVSADGKKIDKQYAAFFYLLNAVMQF